MSIGVNRARMEAKGYGNKYGFHSRSKPCIFLSHRSLDKDMVRKIGKYINKVGIDIYLDESDIGLQIATNNNDDRAITDCIQKGLKTSTHVLCLLSNETASSWWVPYEVGYGEMGDKEIASLKLKKLTYHVPSYLKIRELINNIEELNKYLIKISNAYGMRPIRFDSHNIYGYKLNENASIIAKSKSHPLVEYLN